MIEILTKKRHKMELQLEGMHYEGTIIRPPSEANSILLQVTLGCSHNKCTFCGTYKDKRFKIKDEKIILNDILFASKYCRRQDRVFLMDGDALVIPQRRLVWILEKIREHLPWVKRVGIYANHKSIRFKTDADLRRLRELGLGIVYLGVESGDDQVLKEINKGTTSEHLIKMGQRIKKAGIKLSVTVLLGIGGITRSIEHAKATGKLLTEMDPDYVGALTLILIEGTPLFDKYLKGEFRMPDQLGLLKELREMIRHTDLSRGLFFSNHASNYLPIKAKLPEGKKAAIATIDQALNGKMPLRPEWLRAL